MIDALRFLSDYAGKYKGRGINHEGEAFVGEFELAQMPDLKGMNLRFKAVSESGEVFHKEETTIAQDPSGKATLWSLCSNHPGMLQLNFRRYETAADDCRTLVFGLGDLGSQHDYRQEVSIDLFRDGSLGYRFAWGFPGGEFSPRSGVRLERGLT
jgi:hypothetical protein